MAVCGWEAMDSPDWTDTEIAVRVDPSTGEVLGLDRPALELELADRFPIIEQRWSITGQVVQAIDHAAENVTSGVEVPGALADAAKSIKHDLSQPVDDEPVIPEHMQISNEDPDPVPIEGVTYEAWIAVQGGMLREKVKAEKRHAYADNHGIPQGRWDEISGAWMGRTTKNQGLAIRFAQDLEQAKRSG